MGKKIWNVAKSTALILLMLLVGEIIVEYFVSPSGNIAIPTVKERAVTEAGIDTAFIGASGINDAIIPSVYDELRGTSSFNYGSAAQTIEFTYYNLKDVFEYGSPKIVFIEVTLSRLSWDDSDGEAIVRFDRIRSPKIKAEMFLKMYGLDDVPRLLFKSARYALNYMNADPRVKLKPGYFKQYLGGGYAFANPKRYNYGGRGYSMWNSKVNPEKLEHELVSPEEIDKELYGTNAEINLDILHDIDEMCRIHGAVPVWVSVPVTPDKIETYGDKYDEVMNEIDAMAENENVAFINFQTCEDLMGQLDYSCFKDWLHLNKKGAEIFTKYFASMDPAKFIR